jgi:transcriptional regulator with XRE-family HTH domain
MKLSSHFKSQRLASDLSPCDLAKLVGYKNVAKGANRIVQFEREGIIKEDLLIKIAEALEIDWAMVEELADEDRRQQVEEWNEWADTPVSPSRFQYQCL